MTPNTASGSPEAGKAPAAAAIEFEPPMACVRRILKHSLPNSTNVGKDASAAFARACGIFVIYLTACANDFAREQKRQTITANDVLAAVKELDFDEFTPKLKTFLDHYRSAEKSKRDTKAKAGAAKAAAAAHDDEDEPPSKKRKGNPSSKVDDDHEDEEEETADKDGEEEATTGEAEDKDDEAEKE